MEIGFHAPKVLFAAATFRFSAPASHEHDAQAKYSATAAPTLWSRPEIAYPMGPCVWLMKN